MLAARLAVGDSHAADWKFLTYISFFVLAMTLGIVAIEKKWRRLATVCGIICITYSLLSFAQLHDDDEFVGMLIVGFIQLLMGALFCWLPRPRKAEGKSS